MQQSRKQSKQGTRIDYKGTPILKGYKMHKVAFADQLPGRPLHTILIIENWKEFNSDIKNKSQCCPVQ